MIRAPFSRAISRCSSSRSGSRPFARHAGGGRADLVLGLKLDALIFQGAVIDPCLDPQLGQALIDMDGPGFAPMLQLLGSVPLPHLGAEAVLVHRPHGEHDMGVRLELAVRADVPMDIEIGDHAAIHELSLDEVAGQFDALFPGQFAREWRTPPRGQAGHPCASRSPRPHSKDFRARASSSGATSGVITSEWMTPLLLVKSWSRSSRSSCSREAER